MTNHPQCEACKNPTNQECNKDCIFAPYFPPEKSQEFSLLLQVYGEKEVAELLKKQEDPKIRETILKSLLIEAKARLNDPLFGSAGLVSALNKRLDEAGKLLFNAKKELASYIGDDTGLPTYIPPIRLTNHPQCGACKNLNQECNKDCIFAPYFPPGKSQEFSVLRQVYGEKGVEKILKKQEDPKILEDILKSLVYEAEARLNDAVYGAAGYVSILQQRLLEVSEQLFNAKKELSSYIGEEDAGLPTYIPPVKLQQQLNPYSLIPSPPILTFGPYAAVRWDQPGIDQEVTTAVATLHNHGIPTAIPLRKKGPPPDLQQQKPRQQDFKGKRDPLPLDHGLNKTDGRSSQIDQSPVNHCIYINSSHERDSRKRKREEILV
ncbi:unnamed protein product [Dovyalis caffra]|uniref:LOB domain-containing protein n=1 Tax=Dovyalis caffra TaxID=77055 RepID=A0AAV1RLQ1_9ROSI|nr:unnamed protein product [Dovyalis caffra]